MSSYRQCAPPRCAASAVRVRTAWAEFSGIFARSAQKNWPQKKTQAKRAANEDSRSVFRVDEIGGFLAVLDL